MTSEDENKLKCGVPQNIGYRHQLCSPIKDSVRIILHLYNINFSIHFFPVTNWKILAGWFSNNHFRPIYHLLNILILFSDETVLIKFFKSKFKVI
jgi:hypothetical protein